MDIEQQKRLINVVLKKIRKRKAITPNIRTGINLNQAYPVRREAAPILRTTQSEYEKTGVKALLNKAIDNKAYNWMVEEGIAPELKDKGLWDRVGTQFTFPFKKIISAGMAAPRAESAVASKAGIYSKQEQERISKLPKFDYQTAEYDEWGVPIKPKEYTEKKLGLGELAETGTKAFFNRPSSEYQNYSWAQAIKDVEPEHEISKPFEWTKDQDDWIKGTNWFQKFGAGLAGSPADIAGLGLDIIGDPITYITGGVKTGASTGVKATRNLTSITDDIVIKAGSPITLNKAGRKLFKPAYDKAIMGGKNSFKIIKNYINKGMRASDKEIRRLLADLGIEANTKLSLNKAIKIISEAPEEGIEAIIRKKVTENIVESTFKKMSTSAAKNLVDYGGIKLGGMTMVPGYKFQPIEGLMKRLQNVPGIGHIARSLSTGAGIPEEFLPYKAWVDSAARNRGSQGGQLIADIFKGLSKKSVKKIDDFVGYSHDISKTKRLIQQATDKLDIIKKTPADEISNMSTQFKKVTGATLRHEKLRNSLTAHIDDLTARLPKLTKNELKAVERYRSEFLDGFLKKTERTWGVDYNTLDDYFISRTTPTKIGGKAGAWSKSILGAEKQAFQKGKKLTFSQVKKLEAEGLLKSKPIQEASIQRVSESVVAVARKQMLNEAKGFGSVGKKAGYVTSSLPELKGWYFPEEIIEPMERVTKAFFGDDGLKTIARVYDKIHAIWKRWALATPGFHARNLYSDGWSGWMEYGMAFFDPKLWRDALLIRLNKHKLLDIGEYGMKYADDMNKVMNTSGEMATGFYTKEAMTKSTGQKTISKIDPTVWSTKAGGFREDMGRIVSGLIERKRGSNDIMAAMNVKKVFYDYYDKTTFNRGFLSRVFPFWQWTSKNVPRQLQLMATRPGKYAAIGKVKKYFENMTSENRGKDYDLYKEDYRDELQLLPTNWKTKEGQPLDLWANLPFGDINKLGIGGGALPGNISDMLSPLLKAPIEQVTDTNLFYGSDLRLDQKEPVPKWIKATFGKLPNSLLKNMGMEKSENGERMVMTNRAKHTLRQFPAFANLSRLVPPQEETKTPYNWLSFGAGIKLFPYDENKAKDTYQNRWMAKYAEQAKNQAELTGIDTLDLDDMQTGLEFIYEQAIAEEYLEQMQEAEKFKAIGKMLGGAKGKALKDLAEKRLEEYNEKLSLAKNLDQPKLYSLLLDMNINPTREDIRKAIDDKRKLQNQ